MRYISWVFLTLFGLAVFGFLNYSLPSKTTVRITETYNRLTDIGANAIFFAAADTGTVQNAAGQRDIRFISTVRANDSVYVYRNEDTGWVWPPYFKYDSSNLQAEASNLQSGKDDPQWVSITSYGWRVAWLSIYPNAVSVRPVSGPEVQPRNWGALITLSVLLILVLTLWRMWVQFRERTIDPTLEDIGETWDSLDDRADAARGRLSRWLGRGQGRGRS